MALGPMPLSHPFSDLDLARRLERTEARANAAFVESRARLEPALGATWIEVGGAYALFDGVDSPLTQTFGLGLFEAPTESHLRALEAFFHERGAAVHHEVSPMAPARLLELLVARGYQPVELTSVLYRPIGRLDDLGPSSGAAVRRIGEEEADHWADVAGQGWLSESAELADFVRGMGAVSARSEGMQCFLAELEGQGAGTGAIGIYDGVALLAGASTIPRARRRGVQRSLLQARLRSAAEQGCDLAMMGAAPGSGSQRNAERWGFRIAYTRIKWRGSAA